MFFRCFGMPQKSSDSFQHETMEDEIIGDVNIIIKNERTECANCNTKVLDSLCRFCDLHRVIKTMTTSFYSQLIRLAT